MNRSPTLRAAAFAAALAACALVPAGASAQQPEPAAASLAKDETAKVEQHIKHLHDQLGVTPAEQPQWDQFADVMRGNAAQMNQAFNDRGSKFGTASAVDDMQSYAKVAQVHADNMQKLATAFQSLYDAFPDPQKQVADRVFRNRNPGKKKG